MKKLSLILIIFTIFCLHSYAQIGINTNTPDSSSILEIDATSSKKGFLMTRMTTVERDNIPSPALGLWVYNTDSDCFNYFFGGIWVELCGEVPKIANYTIGSGGSCSNALGNGNYFIETALDGTNTLTIDVTVTTIGTWSINTNITNGYGFSGSGAFITPGAQQVTLAGNGKPLMCGIDSFTLTGDGGAGGTCSATVSCNERLNSSWADRNLGASQVATNPTDALAYGDLYQWGRGTDGHQLRSSSTTTTQSIIDSPGHSNFIMSNATPNDWRNPQNDNLWQGILGINNPCPPGLRVPTENELICERLSWASNNATGAFNSIKLTMGGERNSFNGSIISAGSSGSYWSSTTSTIYTRYLFFLNSNAGTSSDGRGYGKSVRCIND